jgi:uncharacterized cupredoxin-like copper-binding protein
MMKQFLMLVVVILGLLLTLTACGGAGGSSTEIKLSMTDFMFDPMDNTVPAGQEITMTASNSGAVEHEYVIFKYGTDAGDNFGDDDEDNIYWEVEVQPGKSVTETFTAPSEPGEYFVTCGIAGHLQAGMVGKLIVVAE